VRFSFTIGFSSSIRNQFVDQTRFRWDKLTDNPLRLLDRLRERAHAQFAVGDFHYHRIAGSDSHLAPEASGNNKPAARQNPNTLRRRRSISLPEHKRWAIVASK
jgi:hypothetical protein